MCNLQLTPFSLVALKSIKNAMKHLFREYRKASSVIQHHCLKVNSDKTELIFLGKRLKNNLKKEVKLFVENHMMKQIW